MITPEQIAQWREVAEKATFRPWYIAKNTIYNGDNYEVVSTTTDNPVRELGCEPTPEIKYITLAANNFTALLDEIESFNGTAEGRERYLMGEIEALRKVADAAEKSEETGSKFFLAQALVEWRKLKGE
jgi:hypothetical protein